MESFNKPIALETLLQQCLYVFLPLAYVFGVLLYVAIKCGARTVIVLIVRATMIAPIVRLLAGAFRKAAAFAQRWWARLYSDISAVEAGESANELPLLAEQANGLLAETANDPVMTAELANQPPVVESADGILGGTTDAVRTKSNYRDQIISWL